MKKALALLTVLIICLSFSACGPKDNKESGSNADQGEKKYSTFKGGNVEEIPWDANSEIEDYK